ncbi:hypothetical protein GCM10027446_11740 [Angustibacter peucedani]
MTERERPAAGRRPEVVLDVERRAGAYRLVLDNTGDAVALDPRVRFEPDVVGAGEQAVSALAVWSGLAVLRPGHPVAVLVGPRWEPGRFTASVEYADTDGRRYEASFTHDLATYDGLAEPL